MAGAGSSTENVVLMPMWKRTAITATMLIMTLLTAGVIIGYGQLYPLLIDTGVYHHLCPPQEQNATTCAKQEASLTQLFTVGASVSIFVQAPSGIILDFLGPRITCWAGLALFIPGCFMFAFAPTIQAVDAYMIGFQLLAAGGPFVFISSLPVAQLWPDKKAMILMMINGVYGGGAFVFFLFALLYNHASISMKTLFIAYGILGCLIVVVAAFVWPRRPFSEQKSKKNLQSAGPDELSVIEILSKSIRDITTMQYAYLALLIAFLVFKSNFFLSTYQNQFGLHMTSDQATNYSTIFGVVLPGIGLLAGPIGLIFDKFGVNTALIIVIILSTISSVCGLIVDHSVFSVLQIVRMFVFSTYYPMIYGVWAFVIIARFGTANFGLLYGVIAVLAGVVNLAATPPLVAASIHPSHSSFTMANLVLSVLDGVFVLYPVGCVVMNLLKRNKHGSGYYEPIA